ncbi:unnamed protein product [Didymodactylos carnosus]|uniref:K Homology domain-containing protein n=1 Tax=Didymodactylos carnosus TaxID=1234261 RepID=A0A814LU05_9BILA|nr:unnamed protein product [Didymodactylos carnosus]CAF1069664.1 unnamed protein product [Didymodactylos carnosus]CAF3703555.1 unnamed protein product [Didymodactylos carnosus]CAF3836915.1 unnamed protein product [Didymodactylos carnosus]
MKEVEKLIERLQRSKSILNSLPLDKNYFIIRQDLTEWKTRMINTIKTMHIQTLIELDTSYDQLDCYRQTIENILNDRIQTQLDEITDDTSNKIEQIKQKLNDLQQNIKELECLSFKLDYEHVNIVGQLTLEKVNLTQTTVTNDNQHEEQESVEEESKMYSHFDEVSLNDEYVNDQYNNNNIANDIIFRRDSTARVISHPNQNDNEIEEEEEDDDDNKYSISDLNYCRLLITNNDSTKLLNYPEYKIISHHNSPESILMSKTVSQLRNALSIINKFEVRVLIHQSYGPFIVGSLGSRSRMLKEKYSLQTFQVYPTCCPKSTERILLIIGIKHEQILSCLNEIYFNMDETPLNEEDEKQIRLYHPKNYLIELVRDYGGYVNYEQEKHYQLRLNIDSNHNDIKSQYEIQQNNEAGETKMLTSNWNEDFYRRHRGKKIEVQRLMIRDREAGAIYGPGSSRLKQIKIESGANVSILLPNEGNRSSDRTLVIKVNENRVLVHQLTDRTNEESKSLELLFENKSHLHDKIRLKLRKWKISMEQQINLQHNEKLCELAVSFNQLVEFKTMIQTILSDSIQKQLEKLLIMPITNQTLKDVESLKIKLYQMKREISLLKCLSYQLESKELKIRGQIRLCKGDGSVLIEAEDYNGDNQQNEEKQIQDDFLCRLLIPKDNVDKIINTKAYNQFIQISNNGGPERVLTISGENHLDVIEEILSIDCSHENDICKLYVLIHQSYAPFIIGKLGDRSRMLKDKYLLDTIKVYPSCCPRSTERVLYLHGSKSTILNCLDEIYYNINETPLKGLKMLYDPKNYDPKQANEYGGFNDGITYEHDVQYQQSEKNNGWKENIEKKVKIYSALDAWNGMTIEDDENKWYKICGVDIIIKEFKISHGQFGAILGPHGMRLAQIRAQSGAGILCEPGKTIKTYPLSIKGTKQQVNHALQLIEKCIKEHDKKFPFKAMRNYGKSFRP